jgi:hypothetical protein
MLGAVLAKNLLSELLCVGTEADGTSFHSIKNGAQGLDDFNFFMVLEHSQVQPSDSYSDIRA